MRGIWVYFSLERAEARKTLADAAREKKKESKVSGNRSLQSKTFWNTSREVRMQIG